MANRYSPLDTFGLADDAEFARPPIDESLPVGLDDPAENVMTDFERIRAFTVQATTSIESAHNKMIANGVRLLLVVDVRNHVIGLITSTDILGEKSIRIVKERGIVHSELRVADLMTPRERLEAIDFENLARARVGHVVETLRTSGRRHALVVETDAGGRQRVRGLLSATQVEKQLGSTIMPPPLR
jgi:CBS domain-containing protein